MSEQLFNVVAVSLEDGTERILAENKTKGNADEEFYKAVPA